MILPLVTVIITCYNYGQFIEEAIDSILNSDYPQHLIEIIVINDGSTDNTSEIVKKYGKKINYYYIQNTKKVGAIKLGIQKAQGKYIFNLDADDIFVVEKIRKVVEIFESDNEITHVSHLNNYWYSGTNLNLKKTENIPKKLLNRKIAGNDLLIYFYVRRLIFGGGSTYAARTEVIKSQLYFSQSMGTVIDEYLTVITISLGYSYFIGQPLTLYRIHGKNVSKIKDNNKKLNLSQLKVRVNCTEAIEKQLTQSKYLKPKIKALYQLKSQEYSLYFKKISRQDSIKDTIKLYLFLLKNKKYFARNFLLIIWNYQLLKYLIPSSAFGIAKNMKNKIFRYFSSPSY